MSRILILGGGFAGMMAALNATDEAEQHGGDIAVTLVSPSPYLTIRPRLYERDPETLRAPLVPVFEPIGVEFIGGWARTIDCGARTVGVETNDGKILALTYDRLILATGSEMRPLPVPGAADHSFNIDTWDAAVALDRHLKSVLQTPESPGHDCFVIIGAGMCGIEMAAEMRGRIAAHSDAATAAAAKVILIEQAEVVGPDFGDAPRPVIEDALRHAEVELRLGTTVTEIRPDGVTLDDGERIAAATAIVTVGLRASGLSAQIPAERDASGRLVVDDMLRVVGVDGVYATGDIACAVADDGQVALMSCQHGRTMGKYAGYNAARDLMGLAPRPYRQRDYTTCLDLGDFGAVFTTGWNRKLEHYGDEAKKRKRWINGELIYPPTGDRAAILAGGRIDANGR